MARWRQGYGRTASSNCGADIGINMRKEKGFTIIEVLVALALGVLMSLGLIKVFDNSRNLANTETSLSRIQEIGRYVINILAEDIRMVGYVGCSDPSVMQVTVMADEGADKDFRNTYLRGFEVASGGTFSPALPSGDSLEDIQGAGAGNARGGSDVFQVKFAGRTGAKLVENSDAVNANIKVDSNPTELDQGDLAMVSDCKSAHIFEITNVVNSGGANPRITMTHGGNANTPHKMLPGYTDKAELLTYQEMTYFVGDTGRDTPSGQDIYALYKKEGTDAAQELLEGIEFLQVSYGETLDDGNVRFLDADTAGLDFTKVDVMRIAILVQGFDLAAVREDEKTYSLLGEEIAHDSTVAHAGGRTIRKPFTATIKLRNVGN